jgi:hypothetical protein
VKWRRRQPRPCIFTVVGDRLTLKPGNCVTADNKILARGESVQTRRAAAKWFTAHDRLTTLRD